MRLKAIPKKLVGNEEERAVSPVIGVILMVAITVILAAVIAAFVLDIGPGDADPTADVSISGDGTDSVDVELTSMASGSTDGVAIVAEQDIEDSDGDDPWDEGDVLANLSTSGEVVTVEDGEDGLLEDADEGEEYEFTVRAYSGEVNAGERTETDDNEDISNQANSQAIVDEFTVEIDND